MQSQLQQRIGELVTRLRTGYEYIGYSVQRPYLYFVYAPDDERQLRAILPSSLCNDPPLTFFLLDLLPLSIESLRGQEERRQLLLEAKPAEQGLAIVGLWARETKRQIEAMLKNSREGERPVIVLHGTAALHPVGDPTIFMQLLDEQHPQNPNTGRPVPIVVFIPGFYPPQSSRSYQFLSQDHPALTFYDGEYM